MLHCRSGNPTDGLAALVAEFVRDGVVFVGVVGAGCARVEESIDELVAGKGGDGERHILTSSHAGESLEEAVRFAESLTGDFAGEAQVIEV